LSRDLNQLAITMELINFTLMAWQHTNNGFTLFTQSGNSRPQVRAFAPRCTDRCAQRTR
jgi:hypothetical protein